MFKWLIIFFLLGCSCYAISPRLLIILGDNCSFSAEELKKELHATILEGSSDEIKQMIRLHDQFQCNHIFILNNSIEGLTKFSREVGFDVLLVNKDLKSAMQRIQKKIANMPLSDEDLVRMNPKTVGLFYSLMSTVDTILMRNEIPYWVTAGTLLGSIRHKGIIPWDDDLDIGIFEEEEEKLLLLKEQLNTFGLEICKQTMGLYKIYPKNGKTIDNRTGGTYIWRYPFLDIFIYQKGKDNQIEYQNPHFRKIWPTEYFTHTELTLPLSKAAFGPLLVPIPHEARTILTRFYGFDWDKVTYVKWSHEEEKKVKKIKVILKNFSPPDYVMPKSTDFSQIP